MSAADLPDSPDQAPGTQTNADDLLSQLAGSEIDRLLAEADVAAKPLAASQTAGAGAVAEKGGIDEVSRVEHAEALKPAAIEEELPSEEASVTAQLDDLFNELQQGPEQEAAAAPVETAAAANSHGGAVGFTGGAVESAPAAEVADASVTVGTERDALLAAAGFETTETGVGVKAKALVPALVPEQAPAPVPSAEADERSAILSAAGFEPGETTAMAASTRKVTEVAAVVGPAPWYVKWLERINAPVAGLPGVRRVMGLAGVVTLINALALMGYVLFIRKHGP